MTVIIIRALDSEDNSTFPERMSTEELIDVRRQQGTIVFGNQYMNDPVNLSGNFLKASMLNYWRHPGESKPWLSHKSEYPAFTALYAGVDPCLSDEESADWAVVMIGGVADNTLYLLRCIRTHITPKALKDQLVAFNEVYSFHGINFESNAAQRFMADFMSDSTWLPIVKSMTKGQKDVRFSWMSGKFEAGRVLIPGYQEDGTWHPIPEFEPFRTEWLGFPQEAHDDTLDAAEKLVEIATTNPAAAAATSDEVFDRMQSVYDENKTGGADLARIKIAGVRLRLGGLTRRERSQMNLGMNRFGNNGNFTRLTQRDRPMGAGNQGL